MTQSPAVILVVEDDPQMRDMLVDYLTESGQYSVLSAVDGVDALERVLAVRAVDLVISDINMPNMRGFELLKAVRERFPAVKRMLITAYNVEDYFELAMSHDVGNIFVKTSPFNFDELRTVVESLLSGDIFGIERHFAPGTSCHRLAVSSAADLNAEATRAMALLPQEARRRTIETVLVELLTNAVFYGARNEQAERRAEWHTDFTLGPAQAIELTVMADSEHYGVAVVDRGGRLTKSEVLYWLNRQVRLDENGAPIGAYDSHGRGLFIARRLIDRLVINIDPGKRTEVIMMNYLGHAYAGHKPLYINEL